MIVIYTKPDCSFCEKAKSLLTANELPFVIKDITVPDNKVELLERLPTAKTVPQIWVDDTYIGGFTELEKYF